MPSTRIRSLKPEFFTSPSTAQASPPARLLYQAMWCWANDFGYAETNLHVLLGLAFPPSDDVTVGGLIELLREVAAAYGVVFYGVGGRAYYWIPSWTRHNREPNKRSRQWHPTPNDPEAVVDQRFYPATTLVLESSGNSQELSEKKHYGTGERGSCGTGELGSCGTGEPLQSVPKSGTELGARDGSKKAPRPTGTKP